MAVSTPDTKAPTPKAEAGDKSKSTSEAPKPVERPNTKRKDEIVPLGLVNREKPYYGLSTPNKDFLAQSLAEQYKLMKTIASRTPPGPLPSGMTEFIADFERSTKGAKADMSVEELKKLAEPYINADARHEAAAFKIAEWQFKVLQVASGGVVDTLRSPDHQQVEKPVSTMDSEGRVEQIQAQGWTRLVPNEIRTPFGSIQVLNSIRPDLALAKSNVRYEEANALAYKATDFVVDFLDEDSHGQAYITLDRQDARGDMLTAAEKEFVKQLMGLDHATRNVNQFRATANETRTIRDDLRKYAALHRDFYQQVGLDDSRIGNSFIERDSTHPDGIAYVDRLNSSTVLSTERQTFRPGLDSSDNLQAEMKHIFEGFQKTYSEAEAKQKAENVKKVREEEQAEIKRKQGESHNQTMTNAATLEAEYRKPIELTQLQIEQRDKISEELTGLKEKQADVKGAAKAAADREPLEKVRNAILADPLLPTVERANLETAKVTMAYREGEKAKALTLLHEFGDALKPYEKLINQIYGQTPPGTLPPHIDSIFTKFTAAQTSYGDWSNLLVQTQAEVARLSTIVDKPENAKKFKRLDELTEQIKALDVVIKDATTKYTIPPRGGRTAPDRSDIDAFMGVVNTAVDTKQHNLDAIVAPDQQYREIKAESYHEVQELLAGDVNGKPKLEAINERAQLVAMYNIDPNQLDADQRAEVENNYDKVMQIYQNYPPVYIQALQILYGPQITQPGHEEQFRNASNLITPDMFSSILNPHIGNIIDNMYDVDYFRTAMLPALTPRVIADIVNNLRDQVNGRTLGEVDAARKAMRATIQAAAAPATPLDPTNVVVSATAQNFEQYIYYYRDTTDLASQLIDLSNAGVAGLGAGAGIYTDAKAFADLLDARRKAREQGIT